MKKWLDAIGNKQLKTKESFLCSRHFEDKYLRMVSGTYHLLRSAIPTIQLNIASSPMIKTIYNPDKKIWLGTTNSFTLDSTVSYDQMLLKELEKYPDVVIQINHDTGNRMTCKEILLKTKKVAENLKKLNIQIGDYVTIAAEHHDNLVPVFLGILSVGAVINPLHSGFSVLEFNHFLEMVQPKLIICDGCITGTITKSLKAVNHSALMYTFLQSNDDPSIKLVDELFNEFDTNPANYVPPNLGDLSKSLAFILCSSGTTGPPKGVLISHGLALCGLVLRGILNEGEATFNTSSFYWLTSITHIASSIVCRSPRVITTKPITQNLLLEILQTHRVNSLFTAPIYVAYIANGLETIDKWNLSNLRLVSSAGSTLSENIIIAMQKLLPTAAVVSVYGLTDAGGRVACRISMEKLKSVGSLVPGTSAKIITNDLNKNCLAHNEIGEVCLKKPFPLLGYLKNDEATKNSYDSDGWLHTGDLGYFDDDNDLFLVDREKDIFICRGFLVSPNELEGFLEKTFNGIIKDVVIIGIPDEMFVALPAAAIVLYENENLMENDICKAIEDNFSDAKKLRGGVYFFNDLPRTRTGKFLRNLIRDSVCDLYNHRKN